MSFRDRPLRNRRRSEKERRIAFRLSGRDVSALSGFFFFGVFGIGGVCGAHFLSKRAERSDGAVPFFGEGGLRRLSGFPLPTRTVRVRSRIVSAFARRGGYAGRGVPMTTGRVPLVRCPVRRKGAEVSLFRHPRSIVGKKMGPERCLPRSLFFSRRRMSVSSGCRFRPAGRGIRVRKRTGRRVRPPSGCSDRKRRTFADGVGPSCCGGGRCGNGKIPAETGIFQKRNMSVRSEQESQ